MQRRQLGGSQSESLITKLPKLLVTCLVKLHACSVIPATKYKNSI